MKNPTYSDFLLRRLHSLTGLIPLTGFIFFHFFANAYSKGGPEAFDPVVMQLRGLPFLLWIEWGILFAPFLFHMFYGLWIIFTGRQNAVRLPYARNWAYFLQRVTAIIVFVFILYHVIGVRFDEEIESTKEVWLEMRAHFSNPVVYWWYMVGIACTVYHLANGVCTFAMTWGLTVSRRSQRFAAAAMTVVGLGLFVLGVSAVNGFLQPLPPSEVPEAIKND